MVGTLTKMSEKLRGKVRSKCVRHSLLPARTAVMNNNRGSEAGEDGENPEASGIEVEEE